jgi:hypothetical protein
VNQRVGVHGLDCRCHTADRGRLSPDRPIRCQEERGSNPLSRSSKRVGQGLSFPPTDLILHALRPAIQETICPLSRVAQQIRDGR